MTAEEEIRRRLCLIEAKLNKIVEIMVAADDAWRSVYVKEYNEIKEGPKPAPRSKTR